MLIAIAPIVPILGFLVSAGVIGGTWWVVSRAREDELTPPTPVGPGVEPVEPTDGPTPQAVVEGLVGEYQDAAFHDTQSGDSIDRVVLNVLRNIDAGAQQSNTLFQGLRRLVNRSAWNRELYGEPMPNDPYRFDGVAVNRFSSPKHEDAVGIMRTGFFPTRNINAEGRRTGQAAKWGDLWIPALNHDAVRNRVGDPDILLAPPWPDGRPATEPPPELLAALTERT